MDALLAVTLKVLVTTRDRSVVSFPGGLLELGGMKGNEALELLWKTSMTVGQPGDDVRTHITKVMMRVESWSRCCIGVMFISLVYGLSLLLCFWRHLELNVPSIGGLMLSGYTLSKHVPDRGSGVWETLTSW